MEYVFYDNCWNADGITGANFNNPLASIRLQPNETQFVSLLDTSKGRVQRGTQISCKPSFEFQPEADDDRSAHDNISLQQGCGCAATIALMDRSKALDGATENIESGEQDAAIRNKPNGESDTDTTVGNYNGGLNQATIGY
ncbi:hypothetical protein K505DRAFT_254643 [Melanomma pulvis-pyrius CBS 109.77]|uniref:Uncharacterized protein n=1 Tax=Melanomma pulvis-pyrius CBS 109.77 TaxID=1314802 RepID=A0A6A6WY32_9PLEO|nr:hypothetical protein K505DRAFT_254643 [Melanomma pulvis-pyrius CBS 109.77]